MPRERLSVAPLSVLLPKVGDLSLLSSARGVLAERLEELCALRNGLGEAGEAEVEMLETLMEWLAQGDR